MTTIFFRVVSEGGAIEGEAEGPTVGEAPGGGERMGNDELEGEGEGEGERKEVGMGKGTAVGGVATTHVSGSGAVGVQQEYGPRPDD